MLSVLSCIAFEHNPFFIGLAVAILAVGSFVFMRLFVRALGAIGYLKNLWLVLGGLVAGGTVWCTHFVAMLAYNNSFVLGFDLPLTILSLVVAVTGCMTGLLVASSSKRFLLVEIGGLICGLSISAMHFGGILSMKVAGSISHNTDYVVDAIVLGCFFGALAMYCIARMSSRRSNYLGVGAFIAAVACVHFISMTGMQIVPMMDVGAAKDLISHQLIGVTVLFTMGMLLLTTLVTHAIDSLTHEAADKKVDYIARHDPLTGALNRVGLKARFEVEISKASLENQTIPAICIKITSFKEITDVHGLSVGDVVLRHIAKKLSESLDDDELVGRLNGDEFIILGRQSHSTSYASDLCDRLEKLVSGPFSWNKQTIDIDCRIGYAVYPEDGRTAGTVLAASQRALDMCKEEMRSKVHRYDPEKDHEKRNQRTLAIYLREALANKELELHYQLQNNVKTREVCGVEALLRWKHPLLGPVSPDVFIPMAEETGLIVEIGEWVLRSACLEAAEWPEKISVAVNVSSVQLADVRFPETVATVLKETRLNPARLDLEITETGLIADMSHALRVIKELKKLGVGIAMDDFGTGYSSLATLQAFPFDKIKIDRQFIKNICEDRHSKAIVKATIILAESLDIPILAEGVETFDHLDFLDEEGCDQVQGYLFSKPMPAFELDEHVKYPGQAEMRLEKSALLDTSTSVH